MNPLKRFIPKLSISLLLNIFFGTLSSYAQTSVNLNSDAILSFDGSNAFVTTNGNTFSATFPIDFTNTSPLVPVAVNVVGGNTTLTNDDQYLTINSSGININANSGFIPIQNGNLPSSGYGLGSIVISREIEFSYSYTAIPLIGNNGSVQLLRNLGSLTNAYTVVYNYASGSIGSFENSGNINGGSAAIIGGSAAFFNHGSITSFTNSGIIRGAGGDGLINTGTISNFTNSGTIRSFGPGGQYGVINSGTISNLNNSGWLYGNSTGLTNELHATITSLNNSAGGRIGGGGIGIRNIGFINTLINSGDITSTFSTALDNSGTVGVFTNLGQIQALSGNMISNSGAITTFNNAQGGNGTSPSTTALTYAGNLPTNYNIIVSSASSYGQLAVTSPSGTTTFGIYSGSNLTKGTYAAVFTGIASSNLAGSTSGNYNGFTWRLNNSSGSIWDLIVTGASTADTQQSLVNTASVLQGTYTLQNSVMVNGFTYDCSLFDQRGICVSAGGRNTTVQAQGINNTSGLLIASYRLNKNNSRIGAWVDQNLSVSSPSAVKLSNSTPMIGLFGVWSQRPDGVGAEVKVSAAYGQKDTTITRQIVGTSEAGSGSSQLISQGAQVVAKCGFAVMPDVVVSPYAGARYTQNNMGGYTEAATSAVTAPLTYSALNTNATTALAGAEARYRGIPKTTLFASAGVETDTNTSNGSYSATGVDGLTPVNFNPNPVKTRPTATVGGYYDILKNQRIGITGIYRQEPFQAVSTTTVLATYTIGF